MTAPELATLKNDYGTSGVAGPRAADKQVSTGSGTIDSISSFGAARRRSRSSSRSASRSRSTQPTSHADRPVHRHGGLVRQRLAGKRHRAVRAGQPVNRRSLGPVIIGLMVMRAARLPRRPDARRRRRVPAVRRGVRRATAGPRAANAVQPGGVHRGGQLDPRQLPEVVPAGRPAVQHAVDGPGRHRQGGERRRADHAARRDQPARTTSARPGRCRSASTARRATSGAARRSTRRPRWSTASPPTRTATGSPACTIRRTRSPGAAKYLVAHGVQQNVPAAIFAYNHADWYVQEVLGWASTYASGGFTVADVNQAATTPRGRRRQRRAVVHAEQPARRLRRAERDREPTPSTTPRRSSASRTCSAVPGRPPSTAPGWS